MTSAGSRFSRLRDDRGVVATAIVLFPIFAVVVFMFVQGAFWQFDVQATRAAADKASEAAAMYGHSSGEAESLARQQMASAGIEDISVSVSLRRGAHRRRRVGTAPGLLPGMSISGVRAFGHPVGAIPAVSTTRTIRRVCRDEDGGSDVAALVVVVPLILGVVLMFMYFGRQGSAAQGVTHAAAVAARAASMERNAGAARSAAPAAANSTLSAAGQSCSGGAQCASGRAAGSPVESCPSR